MSRELVCVCVSLTRAVIFCPASTHTALVSSPSLTVLHLPTYLPISLKVLEVDILWPRWVARIGVTRAMEACFLTADRQCTELPLLRLPRLVPEGGRAGLTLASPGT